MRGTSSNMISALPHAHLYGLLKASGGVRVGALEVQVVIRSNEYCERCGAKNPFRRKTERRDADGSRMWYARCSKCGASAKIFWR